MNDIYDLVRRADGQTVASLPNNGRWQVYTNGGIASARPLLDEEILITPAGMIQFLQRCGYQVTNLIRE
ncbi:hypothetical protein RQM28_010635 [Citrobacter freundii]|uniref:hypothetical protein n=1 Tax=Citrobacter freundii complex TaxID=1344959 RepID=UPI00242EBE6F|nr:MULTISPECIES: hypothetical protein [Citrobacter freundii complex]MDT7333624.1 hypothetical protein [Citrobacter freundii]WGA86196.1 hypothetical protein NFL11_10675 [Citrobacter braakii]